MISFYWFLKSCFDSAAFRVVLSQRAKVHRISVKLYQIQSSMSIPQRAISLKKYRFFQNFSEVFNFAAISFIFIPVSRLSVPLSPSIPACIDTTAPLRYNKDKLPKERTGYYAPSDRHPHGGCRRHWPVDHSESPGRAGGPRLRPMPCDWQRKGPGTGHDLSRYAASGTKPGLGAP